MSQVQFVFSLVGMLFLISYTHTYGAPVFEIESSVASEINVIGDYFDEVIRSTTKTR